MAGREPFFILATLRGAEEPLFHGVHQAYFHSEELGAEFSSKVKNPTLSQKTRQGWGTRFGSASRKNSIGQLRFTLYRKVLDTCLPPR
jgi:hypothetical protein